MIGLTRLLSLVVLVLLAAPPVRGADIDRTAVDFKTPAEIKWVRNAAGTNEQAVLFTETRASRARTWSASSGFPAT